MNVRVQWEWRLEGADGVLDRPLSPVFQNRFDAEQWLGEHWRSLVEQGVLAVVLQHEGAPAAAPLHLPAA